MKVPHDVSSKIVNILRKLALGEDRCKFVSHLIKGVNDKSRPSLLLNNVVKE